MLSISGLCYCAPGCTFAELAFSGFCCCAHGDVFAVLTKADVVQAALRDKLLQDHSVLAAFLTGLRMYLEDPTKVTHLTFAILFNGAVQINHHIENSSTSNHVSSY